MTTLTAQALTIQATIRKEDRAKEACLLAGITVNYPDNAKGNRVTYTFDINRLAFKQDGGHWIEVNEVAPCHFNRDMLALIANHLKFYSRLVEA